MAAENETAENYGNEEMPTPKIKYDWYQTETHIVINIFAKNSENVKVSYTGTTLSVSAKLPSGSDYSLEIDLAHEIVPEECTHKVLPSKIEVKLKQREAVRWKSLEGTPEIQDPVQPIPKEILDACSKPPTRPPSSSKKSRNWDLVVKEIETEENLEKPAGDEAVNALFKKIYSSGSDEVRRAMNKSFQESGGTVLSTNWSEVGSGPVHTKPPEGMEWKTWDS